MQIEFNNRNFAYGKFEDRYKQKCSIQKSSIATEDCIWLGVDVGIPVELGGTGQEIMGRMHLTHEMAAELIIHLQRFVDTGELYENTERDEAKELLKTYNRWRRGEEIECPNVTDIGKAIDKLTL